MDNIFIPKYGKSSTLKKLCQNVLMSFLASHFSVLRHLFKFQQYYWGGERFSVRNVIPLVRGHWATDFQIILMMCQEQYVNWHMYHNTYSPCPSFPTECLWNIYWSWWGERGPQTLHDKFLNKICRHKDNLGQRENTMGHSPIFSPDCVGYCG